MPSLVLLIIIFETTIHRANFGGGNRWNCYTLTGYARGDCAEVNTHLAVIEEESLHHREAFLVLHLPTSLTAVGARR
jgi:hypothetical protein